MTRQETAKIMSVLKTAYPRYYDSKSQEEIKAAINLWTTMLSEYSYELVAGAVKALIATCKFPPTIADVNEKIQLMTTPEEMSELKAWSYVAKAIKNSAYSAKEEFDKLPEECRMVVCAPEQLRAWSMLSEDEVDTVIASNFQRSYRSTAAKRKEYNMLPESVKSMLSIAGDKLAMLEEGFS